MGISMSIFLCIGITPVTLPLMLCVDKTRRSKVIFFINLIISIILTYVQFDYGNAYNEFETIPYWLIVLTGIFYSLTFGSFFHMLR